MAREDMNRRVRTSTYRTEVQGNVVRKVNVTAPERRERVDAPAAVPYRSRRQESTNLSVPYCLFLAVACVLTLALGAFYLQQQALSTSSQKTIASLESQLAELKKTNADDLNRIETSVNLEEIRNIAINELGMVYPSRSQVIGYDSKESEYVKQYKDISK